MKSPKESKLNLDWFEQYKESPGFITAMGFNLTHNANKDLETRKSLFLFMLNTERLKLGLNPLKSKP